MRHMPQSFQDGPRNSDEMAAIVKARDYFERVLPAKGRDQEDRCGLVGCMEGPHCCVAHCEV